MYLDANETQRGLDNLLTAERMVRNNEHRYARMPPHTGLEGAAVESDHEEQRVAGQGRGPASAR